MVLGILLLAIPHRVGLTSIWVMMIAAWLTWAMALSEVGNSWWVTTQTLPLVARQAGAEGGEQWQELVVTLTHFAAAAALIIA